MIFDCLTEILDPHPHDAAENMARDEALLVHARDPLLRIYRWIDHPVSFGYFGRHREVAERWPGRPLMRRWTGGGEVPHGADVTYTIIVPHPHPFAQLPPGMSYPRIHECLAALFPGATLAPRPATPPAGLCFANPAESDLLLHEAKIAGAAQRRTRHGLLHQGSIQFSGERTETIAAQFAACFSATIQRREFSPDEVATAHELRHQKYGTSAWMQRW
ncbi:MAG: hypothetical protein ABI680_17800 [Chthoniobacteraceae bacterium]